MNGRKTVRRLGAAGISLLLLTAVLLTAAGAIEMPRTREALPGSDPVVSNPPADDTLLGSDMMGGTEDNLGDTEPGADSWIGEADGFIEDPAESDLSGSDSAGDTATDTAGTSSGNTDEGGMSVFGIVITVVIILAVAALVIALLPKKKSGT